MSLSSPAETRRLPSELNATDLQGAEWPFKVLAFALALFVQMRTVESRPQEAIVVPLPFTATSVTGPSCPSNLLGRALGLSPQAKMMPSKELEITCFKLGWKIAFEILA